MAGDYETRYRPSQDPQGAGVALINTVGQGWGVQAMEDATIALNVGAAGDADIKTNKARAKTTPTNRRWNSPTLTTRGSQTAEIVAA